MLSLSGPPEKPQMPAAVSKVQTLLRTYTVYVLLSSNSQTKSFQLFFIPLQPRATAELDRAGDEVYTGVTAMVKQVVQLKNDINTMPSSEYLNSVKVGPSPPWSVVLKLRSV